jgi:Ca2+-binding EF-hand superfamily protein
MRKYVAVCIALSSSTLAARAGAQHTQPTATRAVVEATELPAPADASTTEPDSASVQLLTAADENADGKVTLGELGAFIERRIGKRVGARHAQLDRNHDGRVTRSEVPKMLAARFARFDLNRDGSFTSTELLHVMTGEVKQRLQTLFARLDLDGDTRVSLAELSAQRQVRVAVVQTPAPSAPRNDQAKASVPTRF